MTDFAFMPLEQRRDALLALSKSTEPCLGALGLEPASEPVYVMSTDDSLVAGTHTECLAAAAVSLGMNVIAEPILVQGGNNSPDTFEVWADMCGTATRLASATTRGEALAILQSNLTGSNCRAATHSRKRGPSPAVAFNGLTLWSSRS